METKSGKEKHTEPVGFRSTHQSGTCTMSILDLHVAVSWTYSVHSKDEMTSDFPRTSSLNFSMTLSLSTV